ncbi:YjbA family protein [Lentibacillus saliphilus]|uniref:YjbA family protein n=1 Tax=Lentibacillus saliphilus TaxID=2737028 RepID=UPI001C2FBA94|nr:YjbA family protein [Lentibacillus saliphilus]
MLYLHDVWVNWFEGEENGYNVCYFHEWRKEDKIELLDQVPLLYITKPLYQYIENDMHDIPQSLLDAIYRRAYARKGQIRKCLDYACVVTDGVDIMALDTAGYSIPIKKSRLIPRQEQLVFDMVQNIKPLSYQFDDNHYEKKHHMLSMSPDLVFGLTRRERQLKQLMMMGLDQLKTANRIKELRYWLTEWDPKQYPYIHYMDEEKAWHTLYNSVKHGWSSAHEDFCKKLVKGQPFLEKMWEFEQKQKPTSKQQ